ncbi:MAG: TerC family protein [Geminicoccaceae bacterium]
MAAESTFWLALGEIVWINVLLSGDNAVVIALACRSLPQEMRKWGILLGVGPAIILRAVFTAFVGTLLGVPYLKLVGAGLLLWIAVSLMLPDHEEDPAHAGEHHGSLWAAVRTIVVADAVMSLDNVIAIAAAAKGDMVLLIIGLLLSMPMIIFGSGILLRVMERFPILVTAGAGLLGWIAGELAVSDPLLHSWLGHGALLETLLVPALGAALVVTSGYLWAAWRRRGQMIETGSSGR